MLRYDEQLTAIALATEEFLDEVRQRRGESAEKIIAEYANRYPDIQSNINDLFPALIGIEKIAVRNHQRIHPNNSYPELPDYEIVREIGRGGMGIVYEAVQLSLSRRVALKTLSLDPEANPSFLERFSREAKTAASLHHSNIVPVFDVGCENGIHYFSMQYIDGINLSELCRFLNNHRQPESATGLAEASTNFKVSAEAPTVVDVDRRKTPRTDSLSPQPHSLPENLVELALNLDYGDIARIGSEIADALHYIHRQGIIHRDIKPSNILLDASGKPWLADWGLVRSEISELTQTGDLFGSLTYMSPERFKGHADATSDIYSLGATLYELVTLRRIFEVEDQVALVATIVNDSPTNPSELMPDLSRDFENVILKSVDKQPAARYRTSRHFAADLRNLYEGRPVTARRLSIAERTARWCRRQPWIAALSALTIMTLIAGLLVSSMFAIQANRARQRAQLEQQQSEQTLDVFFGTFFPQASPDENAQMSPQVRKQMDDAVAAIMGNNKYDPVVVGKLFNKLGWIYFNQQDYDQALSVFQHSHQRVADAMGGNHAVALTALDHVGMTYMRLDDYESAEQTLLEAWQLQAETLGPLNENTIHSYAKLGDLYQYTGDFDQSIRITKEVMQIRMQPGRPDGNFATVSMNGLANSYIQMGRFQEAVDLLQFVVEKHESNNRINLGFSVNLFNLARAHRHLGNLDESRRLIDRCLEIRERALGQKADSLLGARAFQAGLMADTGNAGAALERLNEIWSDAETTNLNVRKAMIQLEMGRCLQKLGDTERARAVLGEAWQTLQKYRSNNNLYTKMAKTALEEIEN